MIKSNECKDEHKLENFFSLKDKSSNLWFIYLFIWVDQDKC